MTDSNLKKRVLIDMEQLITTTCPRKNNDKSSENFHKAILKKYYNATNVSIDYKRKRVEMDLVLNDKEYNPQTINLHMHTVHANFRFKNLSEFLQSCIDYDPRSIAFYASLLCMYAH